MNNKNLIEHNCKLILASSSKIRQKILQEAGLKFEIITPFYDEDNEKKNLDLSPKNLSIFLAKQKALSVSERFPDIFVIGSDQVCEFEGKEFSKSKDAKEAISQLKKFNGKDHYQNNAAVIAFNGKIIYQNFSRVKMRMRKISSKEIENYVLFDESWGCAGSYKYESFGKHLFDKVTGDYYAILGIAIQPLLNFLHTNKLIKISS